MQSILVNNLGKAYKKYNSRWARLAEWVTPGSAPHHQLTWVLRDINFTLNPGEAVGIIGINGAGKSTLLKMITGTTQPTTGSVQLHGRVAALLELGMGFHPDFTGRQNAIMAGQLLGFSVEEIQSLMPAIEEFAEIGDYIDQPVRVYSSGMQMRLAFSVATASRPDILIVDEALSVGDTYFQHKSFERIRQFNKEGSTLLLVSHDKSAIQSICNRAILLNAGLMAMEGEPEAVMDYYNAMLAGHQNQTVRRTTTKEGKTQTISGTKEVSLESISLCDEQGNPLQVVQVGQPVCLQVNARAHADVSELVLGYMIKDRLGQPVFGTNTYHHQQTCENLHFDQQISFSISFPANLGEGSYSIAIALHTGNTHLSKNFEWRDLALLFDVVNVDKPEFIGIAWLPPSRILLR